MSNGDVKRWQAPHMMRYRLPAERESETDYATEAYATPCSVVLASDHDRIVAEKDAAYNKLDDINMALNEKIATQKRVITELERINRTFAWHYDDYTLNTEVDSEECSCGLIEAMNKLEDLKKL